MGITIEQICELVQRSSRPNIVMGGVFSTNMKFERKGYFLIAIIFMTASSFHLAKLIRDKNAASEGQNVIAPYRSYAAFVYISWFLSVGLAFGGLQVMEGLDKMHRTFVLTGMAYVLASVINLAKSIRDNQEMRAVLANGVPVAEAVAAADQL